MIAILQASLVLLLVPVRLRWAIYLFLFFLAFAPRSLGIISPDGLVSLTFARMVFPILFVAMIWVAIKQQQSFRSARFLLPQHSLFWILLAWSATKLVATLLNGRSPLWALDDMLFTVGALTAFYVIASTKLFKGVVTAILTAFTLTAIAALVEYQIARPVHYSIADQTLLQEGILLMRERHGVHRIQGVFDGVHLLVEFILYAMPLAIYRLVVAQGLRKVFYGILIISMTILIAYTGARSALIVAPFAMAIFFIVHQWSRLAQNLRLFAGGLFIATALLTLSLAFTAWLSYVGAAAVTAIHTHDEETRSLHSRALEYIEIYSAISSKPFTGYGVVSHFARELEEVRRNDNYYLRVALESGLPGLILFITFLFITAKHIVRKTSHYVHKEDRAFRALAIALVCTFAIEKLFLSQPTNNIYFFALLGIILRQIHERALSHQGITLTQRFASQPFTSLKP